MAATYPKKYGDAVLDLYSLRQVVIQKKEVHIGFKNVESLMVLHCESEKDAREIYDKIYSDWIPITCTFS